MRSQDISVGLASSLLVPAPWYDCERGATAPPADRTIDARPRVLHSSLFATMRRSRSMAHPMPTLRGKHRLLHIHVWQSDFLLGLSGVPQRYFCSA